MATVPSYSRHPNGQTPLGRDPAEVRLNMSVRKTPTVCLGVVWWWFAVVAVVPQTNNNWPRCWWFCDDGFVVLRLVKKSSTIPLMWRSLTTMTVEQQQRPAATAKTIQQQLNQVIKWFTHNFFIFNSVHVLVSPSSSHNHNHIFWLVTQSHFFREQFSYSSPC